MATSAPESPQPSRAQPTRSRPTLHDVARLAGVSPKTVSRVVNAEPGVSPSKVIAVERAIKQLDYRPNFTASSLRRANGRPTTIATALEDLANPFSAVLHRALEDAARERGVLILAGSLDEDPDRERAIIRAFTMRQVDALIVAPASDDHSYLAGEVNAGTPVVFVDRPPVGLAVDAVLADNYGGAASAVRHLAKHGHRHVAYLGDLQSIATARMRYRGFREAMADLDLRLAPEHVVHDLHTQDDAEAAARRLLTADAPPTALFTSQNLVTIGAIRALQKLGRQHEIALVGFDDFPLADVLQPAVTVVAQNPAQIGTMAASLAFRRLDGESWEPTVHRVPTLLIARGSGEIAAP